MIPLIKITRKLFRIQLFFKEFYYHAAEQHEEGHFKCRHLGDCLGPELESLEFRCGNGPSYIYIMKDIEYIENHVD